MSEQICGNRPVSLLQGLAETDRYLISLAKNNEQSPLFLKAFFSLAREKKQKNLGTGPGKQSALPEAGPDERSSCPGISGTKS